MEVDLNDLKTALSDLENRASRLEEAQQKQDMKKIYAYMALSAYVLLATFLSLWFLLWAMGDIWG